MEKKEESYATGTKHEKELKKWHKPELKELVARRTDASVFGTTPDGGTGTFANTFAS